jgi:hypothetical protein
MRRLRATLCLLCLPLVSGQGLFGGMPVDHSAILPRVVGPPAAEIVPGAVRTFMPGDIVFRTPILYARGAVLEAPLRVQDGAQAHELPHGTSLALIPDSPEGVRYNLWRPPNGEIYCLDTSSGSGALRFPILTLGTTTKRQRDWARYRLLCLADTDRDRRFDILSLSDVRTNSIVAPATRVSLDTPVPYSVGEPQAIPGENEVRVRYVGGNIFGPRFDIDFIWRGRELPYDRATVSSPGTTVEIRRRTGIRTSKFPQTLHFPRIDVTVLGLDRKTGAIQVRTEQSTAANSYSLHRSAGTSILYVYVPR